jgi:hypothetical protein
MAALSESCGSSTCQWSFNDLLQSSCGRQRDLRLALPQLPKGDLLMSRSIAKRFLRTLITSVLVPIAPIWLNAGALAQIPPVAEARELPSFEVDPAWPRLPPQWKLGDVSHINADSQGNVYVLHRPRTLKNPDYAYAAPPVLVFDSGGNFLRAWGGDGPGYDWPQREHGIYIDPKSFVWIGGNSCPTPDGLQRLSFTASSRSCGNNCPIDEMPRLKPVTDDQLLKFTADGKFVMQIGHSNQSRGNADPENLHRPSDAHYYAPTNEIFVSDGYGNHRVVVFDADTGAFKRMWGGFGNRPQDDDHCEIVAKDDGSPSGPAQFNIVHSLRVSNDGMVYVADRENRRVQSFTVAGAFLKQLRQAAGGPRAASLAFSPDAEQKFLYVGNSDDITVIERRSLEIFGTIKPPGSIGGGHMIGVDPSGNIYVASPSRGVQKLAFKGTRR